MMYKGSDVVAGGNIPDSHCRVRRSGDDDPLIVLQTQNGSRVPSQYSLAGKRIAIPHFDSVVPQSGDNFLIVVLQAIDTFGVLTAAVNALKVVLAAPPIILYRLNVLDDGRVELAVKAMIGMVFARPGLEQGADPASPLGQAPPEGVGVNFSLDELFPEHAVADDSLPLLAH